MKTDLLMLAWTAAVTAVMWVPYILSHISGVGLKQAVTYRADEAPRKYWAVRAKRAHYNAIENLVPFTALVLVAHLTSQSSHVTAMACIVFFWARLAHYIVYVAGIPYARTLCFAVAWVAMACIFWEIVT